MTGAMSPRLQAGPPRFWARSARLTGEILRSTPGTVNHNTLVLMAAPQFIELEQNLLRWLAPHPEALRVVVEGLQRMQQKAPEVIDARPA